MKADTKCTSKVQMLAQKHLRRMPSSSAHLDNIDANGGVDDLAAHHQQQAVDVRAATTRCIENLTAANTDEECAEALRAITTSSGPSCISDRCNDFAPTPIRAFIAWDKGGAQHTDRLPGMVESFRRLPTRAAILDGEQLWVGTKKRLPGRTKKPRYKEMDRNLAAPP